MVSPSLMPPVWLIRTGGVTAAFLHSFRDDHSSSLRDHEHEHEHN